MKLSDCSASAFTSRLRTSYSSSTRWIRTSHAFLLRRSGERRPRVPKPSKRGDLTFLVYARRFTPFGRFVPIAAKRSLHVDQRQRRVRLDRRVTAVNS